MATARRGRQPGFRTQGAALALGALLGACSAGPVVPSRAPSAPEPASPAAEPPTKAPDAADANKAADADKGAANERSGPPTAAPEGGASGEVLYDEVLAIVDAKIVTLSSVREDRELEIQARLARARKEGGVDKIPPSEVQAIENQLVRLRIRDIMLSDSVNTLGFDPKRIEATVQRLVDERVQSAERAAGGSLEFVERLKERGETYDSFRADLRDEIRGQLSISEKMREAGTTSQLLATPREMRAYYEEKKLTDFTTPRAADLELMRFAPREGAPAPAERAALARRAIVDGKASRAAVEANGGDLDVMRDMRPDDASLEILRSYAFDPQQSVGAVSSPIPRGPEVWLLRLARRSDGGTRPFTDESVQREIRDALAAKRKNELYLELLEQEQRRTKIWPEDVLRGR